MLSLPSLVANDSISNIMSVIHIDVSMEFIWWRNVTQPLLYYSRGGGGRNYFSMSPLFNLYTFRESQSSSPTITQAPNPINTVCSVGEWVEKLVENGSSDGSGILV